MYRVALVASHVIQYQAPFFRLLAQQPELDLHVLYCSRAGAETYHDAEMGTTLRWDLDLLSGYKYSFLKNYGHGEGTARLINPSLVPAILKGNYDAVIFFLGWGTITSLLGIAACRLADTPFFLFGDSSWPPPPRLVRDAIMRSMFRMTEGFLVSGVVNADYYKHYGADPSRFFLVPWAIDNDRFTKGSEFAPGEREAMRKRFGFRDDQLAIVFSAKLIARKDPMTLLRAVDRMKHRDRAAILFLGHGELRDEMETFAREHHVNAHFAGFVNQTELPKFYASADVFVLPTLDDPRGTVTNEAMACGLPVIVTDRLGAVGDIVLDGENGFVFPAGDVAKLASQLDFLVENPHERDKMAARSRELIATWDYEAGVKGVMEALRRRC